MTNFDDFLTEQLSDPELRAEYDALEPEFTIIQAMIDARHSTGMTQKQLSDKTGIAQGDISKNGNRFIAKFKKIYLGSFRTAEETARAYDNYLKENNINGLFNFEEENK